MGYESDMIEIRHVTKVFNKNRPNEFTALHGVSLDLKGNRAIVFSGPSGSGKTTLLSIIGVWQAYPGTYLCAGRGDIETVRPFPD